MNSRILIPKYPPNTYNRKRQGAISPRGDIHRKSTGKYGVSVYKNKSSGFLVQASKQSHLASAPKKQGECFLSDRVFGRKDRATGIQDPGKPYYPAGSPVFHAQISQARRKDRRKLLRTADAAAAAAASSPAPSRDFLEGREAFGKKSLLVAKLGSRSRPGTFNELA